jgi:phage I-like protein
LSNTKRNPETRGKVHYLVLSAVGVGGGAKEIQIMPYGAVKSKAGDFVADKAAIKKVIENFRAEKNDVVIDYEHQSLSGGEAPAAGWIKELTDKGEAGLWASVEWTPRGAEYIKNGEYRYLSPVVSLDKDKRAAILWSAGLTNTPAIDGMTPIANKKTLEEENNVEFLKELAALLGLAETATAEDVTGALKTLQEKAAQQVEVVANKEVLALLDLKEGAKLGEVKGAVLALKNPSGYVKAEEFAKLKNKLDLKERDDLVTLALTSGKVAPASKDWAESYALKDPEGFKVFLNKAPAVVPLKEAAGAALHKAPPEADDDLQLSVNKALGIDPEDFKKYSKGEGK